MSSSEKKKERRRERYERNVAKEIDYKKRAWEEGKLIEENHNNKSYSAEYSKEISRRLVLRLEKAKEESCGDNELFLLKYRLYKNKIRDFILLCTPETCTPEDEIYYNYNILKGSLEVYWDEPEKLLEYITEMIN